MRFLLRNIVMYSLSLFALQVFFTGVSVNGGIGTYLLASVVLTILYYTLRPILQLLTFPINMATLGVFGVLINTFILYILSVIIPNIVIKPFLFSGFSFFGFIIPRMHFNAFFAYVICGCVISCITTAISWLFGE